MASHVLSISNMETAGSQSSLLQCLALLTVAVFSYARTELALCQFVPIAACPFNGTSKKNLDSKL